MKRAAGAATGQRAAQPSRYLNRQGKHPELHHSLNLARSLLANNKAASSITARPDYPEQA